MTNGSTQKAQQATGNTKKKEIKLEDLNENQQKELYERLKVKMGLSTVGHGGISDGPSCAAATVVSVGVLLVRCSHCCSVGGSY